MILGVQHIAKDFGKRKVLKDVTFEMAPGTLCGIVGENGSGKSTLLKIIAGEWKADGGKIAVYGSLGYCPQQVQLFSRLTVEENFQYFAAAYGMNQTLLSRRSEILMDHFQFWKFHKEKVATLSGGTQQKLNLCIALLHQPSLLILDEPYSGFDWETYLRFWEYAGQLRDSGCAILVVTHLVSEKERFDRIYQLEHGELI